VTQISKKEINKFLSCLDKWRTNNGLRDFPWRKETNPFIILITEMLLRRTKADAVNNIWSDFFNKYKDFDDLATVNEIELKKDISSLGLATIRSRNLIEIGKKLTGRNIPETERELIKLKGVGIYSARMYLMITKGTRQLIYDSNFRRVYSRYFGVNIDANLRSNKKIVEISELIIPKQNFKDFILTILDFAALICKPVNPKCDICCCNKSCVYYKKL